MIITRRVGGPTIPGPPCIYIMSPAKVYYVITRRLTQSTSRPSDADSKLDGNLGHRHFMVPRYYIYFPFQCHHSSVWCESLV